MEARIVGWGHTRFGVQDGVSLEALIQQAAAEAMATAGVAPGDIDAIWLGHFNNGMVPDAFAASLVLGLDEALRFTPATRVENACASGSAAVYAARNAIRAGDARCVLVVGVEKMTELDTLGVTAALAGASYAIEEAGVSFPQIFGRVAAGYFQAFGDQSETLARIAVKNHTNALNNPLAHMQREVSFDFCNEVSSKNPMIAAPLRLTDCSLISDGAAALVMVADEMTADFDRAVGFRAAVQMNDFLPMSRRDMTELTAARRTFDAAYRVAGITIDDLDLAEVHDCFTIAELMIYEAMGLAEKGKGARLVAEGATARGGRLPVNLSGGLKAKGHPVGATGVSMHVLAAQQVAGQAGGVQLNGAELACVFNMGGSGVANYCSILEAVR
ncbi:acetyl-CoA acetyltransferase [Marivivens sp. JLT3646]|uniref:acetyl-CoA acetyltransferase n=1 Tax=Marivivens sp. JLT3646 TaxID=1920883 RepID=UPI0007FF86AE|nr:acetyl-CoA acetyltransferase [Marivivens sp. JLT3646]APO86602.1 acetyl-CoA acetyltransferase [Marivivens sp. JLT3646]OBR38388.1 acetyl-CoA acetyltransferase [Donghicola sp. JL3646]